MQAQKPLVDFEFGLSQLGGNAGLLSKMLVKFKQQFEQIPEQFAQQLQQGDYETARINIHTAKGITGNLGLKALFDCCETLDTELKQMRVTPDTLNAFHTLMFDTCLAIDEYSVNNSAAAVDSVSSNVAQNAKSQLVQLLTRHEFIDEQLLRNLVGSLDLPKPRANTIIELVEQLQYEQAIALLNE